MKARILKIVLLSIIPLFVAAFFLHAGELPYTWYVNADGEEGTLQISTGGEGVISGTLLGQPVEGRLLGRRLLLVRHGDAGPESWEAWVGTGGDGEMPVIAGVFTRPDSNEPLPWFGAAHRIEGDQQVAPSTGTTPAFPSSARGAGKTAEPTEAATKRNTTIAPLLPDGKPSLQGTWQTPDGPLKIRQDGSKLIFELPDREVSGRLTGQENLIGGFAPGCCKGHLEQAYTVIAWDNGTRWFRK